jgi:hypothetical protein
VAVLRHASRGRAALAMLMLAPHPA